MSAQENKRDPRKLNENRAGREREEILETRIVGKRSGSETLEIEVG